MQWNFVVWVVHISNIGNFSICDPLMASKSQRVIRKLRIRMDKINVIGVDSIAICDGRFVYICVEFEFRTITTNTTNDRSNTIHQ